MFKIQILLFFSLLLLSCGEKPYDGKFRFSENLNKKLNLDFQREIVITEDTSNGKNHLHNYFTEFIKISKDGGTFLLLDEYQNKIILTDTTGKIYSEIAGKGRGPKEILEGIFYDMDDNNLITIADQHLQLFKVFDKENNLIRSFPIPDSLPTLLLSFKTWKDNLLLNYVNLKLSAPKDRHQSELLAMVKNDGEKVSLYGKWDDGYADMNNAGGVLSFDVDNSGHFYSMMGFSYRIQVYDLKTNEKIDHFGFKSPHFKELSYKMKENASEEEYEKMWLEQSVVGLIAVSQEFIVVTFGNASVSALKFQDWSQADYYLAVYDHSTHSYWGEISLKNEKMIAMYQNKIYTLVSSDPEKYTLHEYVLSAE